MIRILVFLLACLPGLVYADDGSRLWLDYKPVPPPVKLQLMNDFNSIVADTSNVTLKIAAIEFQNAFYAFTGVEIPIKKRGSSASLILKTGKLSGKSKDEFSIRKNSRQTIVESPSEVGILYGTFYLIRLIQCGDYHSNLSVEQLPSYQLRMLNHWDNPDGTVERGYAGHSLWKWDELPLVISPRYAEYARANASIGINAMVPNNVNASPSILTSGFIVKLQALANVFRPYGIRLFVAINFSSPSAIGGLDNSDPQNPEVQKWWNNKTTEIYRHIPDFGGFLVKANSEGLPGPQDYGHTHAQGANMLAKALKPFGGLVIWRAFVYNPSATDRVTQALDEFLPLDGFFDDNVIVQIKNGPLDFQPREPFSPLFGRMTKTTTMVEFQLTQEYLGFSNHLVYLAPLFSECLHADTYARGLGSTVVRVTDGSLYHSKYSAIAGVANIGQDDNWCGHPFAQANWYAFGRLAWNHQLQSESIAHEWLTMTFTPDSSFVAPITQLMMHSREAAVNYMMPLGLHHIFAWDHHYGPEPWCNIPGARPDWMPSYYHNASTEGIGFNRTLQGSGAVLQYNEPLRSRFNNLQQCPENLILWFHFVPWQHVMDNGNTLWEELCHKYQQGVDSVRNFQKTWDRMEPYIDTQRFMLVQSKLKHQSRDAVWWRDACLLYFQTFSKQPIPYTQERPIYDLDELKQIKLNLKHHN